MSRTDRRTQARARWLDQAQQLVVGSRDSQAPGAAQRGQEGGHGLALDGLQLAPAGPGGDPLVQRILDLIDVFVVDIGMLGVAEQRRVTTQLPKQRLVAAMVERRPQAPYGNENKLDQPTQIVEKSFG